MTDDPASSDPVERPDDENEQATPAPAPDGDGSEAEPEAEAAAEAEGASQEETEPEPELDPLEKAEKEASEWRERAMRTQAELENFRKRMTRDRGEAIQYANASLLESLLPILDNFEMGLKAARVESEDSVIYQGMNMVFRQTQDFLRDNGIEAIDAVGKAFDPNRHEAVEQQFSDEVDEGHVIAELRRGYRLGERLLRAANVIVSKGQGTDDGSAGAGAGEAAGNAVAGESEDAAGA
jgi:molecular chaperone GrpE